jgi:cyclopropane fatty-acyl-phospholipid synthase-like methyltransferase
MIHIGKKIPQFYKGILMMVDLNMHEHIFLQIKKRIPIGSKILDMGCGEGALSQRLVDAGYVVTSVDKDPSYFKCRGSTFIQLNFDNSMQVADFLKSHNDNYDAVIGIEVIEHVENQWEYVRNLHFMCKNNGYLFISTPNTTSWLSRLRFLRDGRFHQFSDSDLSYGHISPLSPWEFMHILKSIGLRDVRIEGVGTLPHIYISSFSTFFASLFSLPLRLFQRGFLNGWCVLAIGQK